MWTDCVAPPTAACPSTARPGRTTSTSAHPEVVALGQGHRRRVREDRRDPTTRLTIGPSAHHPKEPGDLSPAAPGGPPSCPNTTRPPRSKITRPDPSSQHPHDGP